tara:strand:+ start:269 stop:904 length:636 start_codon:yes stop_codon:yes gene_type:complete
MALVKYNNNSLSSVTSAAGFPSGAMTLIKTITADSASTVSFINGSSDVVFDNTHPIYLVKIINAHLDADDRSLNLNFTTDGTNFNVTKTTTFFRTTLGENGSNQLFAYRTFADLAQSTGDQVLGEAQSGGSGHTDASICVDLMIFNPSSTTFVKHFIARTQGMSHLSVSESTFIAGYCNTTSALTGFQFDTGGGSATTIDGTFKLYGLNDS